MNTTDIICPKCYIAIPTDAITHLHTNLCKMCLAELTRKVNEQ